jgi:PEP-CTERM motif
MKKLNLFVIVALVASSAGGAKAANLLINGDLDAGVNDGAVFPGWTLDESKTFSGPTTDLLTTQSFVQIPPITVNDLGGFVKAFQGNATTGDLANLNFYQDVVGLPGIKYVLTGMIGAGANYSGLLNGPTQTLLAIDFDNDTNAANGVISSVVTDVKAAGLTSGGGPAFGAQQFTATGVAPAGTTSVRARFSALNMYNTTNPDPAAMIDDFNLSAAPEPATIVLGLIAAAGMLGLVRRHR